jgi:hypothetical protein
VRLAGVPVDDDVAGKEGAEVGVCGERLMGKRRVARAEDEIGRGMLFSFLYRAVRALFGLTRWFSWAPTFGTRWVAMVRGTT